MDDSELIARRIAAAAELSPAAKRRPATPPLAPAPLVDTLLAAVALGRVLDLRQPHVRQRTEHALIALRTDAERRARGQECR